MLSSKVHFLILLTLCVPYELRAEDYDYLKVPANEFVSSINMAVEVMREVSSVLSQFGEFGGDLRLQNAVSDCLDLLDFSSDELSWSASASQNPKGKGENGTGDVGSDMKTWLSAALSNQDTCIEGFDGTNGLVKALVAGSLNQLYSMLRELLPLVQPDTSARPKPNPRPIVKPGPTSKRPRGPPGRKLINTDDEIRRFPDWVRSDDRKLLEANDVKVDVTVALDGTGDFTKITDAVKAAPDYSSKRFVIYVKKGVYSENVEIKKKKWNLVMIGDGIDVTVISGNRSFIDGWTTFRSATFAVSGRGFLARDITFQNTAGPEKHQAVAMRSDSDLSVFYRCAMKGYQDTLYTHTMRQFYRDCIVTGTVDFIFGDATVVFQNCQILARRGLPNQKNTITAQGRKDPNQPTGFSIQFSNISAEADLIPYLNTTRTYLGRPWKQYSRTVFLQNYMSNVVRPEGWLEWNGDFALDTLFYGEFMNYGPGSGLGGRVKWPGYRVFNDSAQANNFTVAQFIDGNLWIPSTGVRYTAGLSA
ncbi:PREDICTED: probable pectinesterase/pectinesterase inhibitor 44 [Tarenaya hassleriana]|uniref:probable pectinesterase/pectinesterase inhibitor 44 n=1 Tax=Tarenaya hassleriana TaxID=28532 RepID=UPI00053C670C|nr:PREDICTED: probable pectinesterase/pectinesterase inhibitor 44 [Tarenaya hassleriana]